MVDPVPRRGDRRRARIGLLGGSFNPAHAGHRHAAELALRRLRLDQVWLLVSPGNPLKSRNGMAPFSERLQSARRIADGRRIVATGIERMLGTRYTADTIAVLRQRFPRAAFVWIMGADNLLQFPRWNGWMRIVEQVPFAVLPRSPHTLRALASLAAQRLRRSRVPDGSASRLLGRRLPAWVLLLVPEHPASATAIRARLKEKRDHRS